jgi:hypothetical protein
MLHNVENDQHSGAFRNGLPHTLTSQAQARLQGSEVGGSPLVCDDDFAIQ